MKKYFKIILFLIIGLNITSCTYNKNILYLQDSDSEEYFETKRQEYLIQTNDILHVKVLSINKDIVELYNLNNNTNYTWNSQTSLFINGFVVDPEGNINLPVLGSINVRGLSIEKVQALVQKKVDESLKNATAIVKLISFKVTVLGEVKSPGEFTINNHQLTIFEALGLAGDAQPWANKKNILLIRTTEKGTFSYNLDLTSKNILTSDYYYLLPNDVLYIRPVKAIPIKESQQSLSVIIALSSLLVSVLSVLKYYL